MEIIKPIFFILTSIVILYLLIYYIKDVESKRDYKWYEYFIVIVSSLLFVCCFFLGAFLFTFVGEDNRLENTYEYRQGYKVGINTQFEQRIDTVYIKKK